MAVGVGSGGMLSRKIFDAAMAVLVLFFIIFTQIFLTLILSTSSNMMHFVRTLSINRA